MMRNILLYLLLLLWMAGCKENLHSYNDGGLCKLEVEVLTDQSVDTKAGNAVYQLDIMNAEGVVVKSYKDCTGVSEPILLPAGVYTLTASTGEKVGAGFEKPFYQAVEKVTLEAGTTKKQVALVCTLANVKATVSYSDRIKKYFKDYSLKIHNGIDSLIFVKDEKRAGYLQVNQGTFSWVLTLDNGQEKHQIRDVRTNVQARQYYRFAFDIKESGSADGGAFDAIIKVDTSLAIFDWVCDIVLKDSISRPTLTRRDGGLMKDKLLVLDQTRGVDAALNFAAQAKVKEMTVQHRSAALKALGIPESFMPTNITPELKTKINTAGITWTPDAVSDAQTGTVDFSNLLNSRSLGLGEYEFYLSIYDGRNRLLQDTLRISVIPDIDHVADEVNVMDVWAKFATIRGRWYTLTKPTGLALEYSTDQIQWTPATEVTYNEASKTFSAYLKNLQPATTYYFRTTGGSKGASTTIRSFTTEDAIQLPYMNFDTWYMDGSSPVVGVSGQPIIWDSGNKGGAGFGIIPTTEEKTVIVKGAAAKLSSLSVPFKGLAAGNLYTGQFAGKDGVSNVFLDFGTAYTCRPTTLSGYYKYQPGTIDKVGAGYGHLDKKMDSCHIYVALTDWDKPFRASSKTSTYVNLNDPAIIALGELKTDKATAGTEVNGYEKFTIKLNYRDKTRRPKHILIVASASKYGDYFTGSTSSVLWIDEFELGFDPVQ